MPGGAGVDQLAVGETVPFPAEVGLKVPPRDPGSTGPDNEPQPHLIHNVQVSPRQHAGVGHDHEFFDAVGDLEGLHNRDDGVGSSVAFPAT